MTIISRSVRLRDVCIQDPRNEATYMITADQLRNYLSENEPIASENTVVFSIADDALIDDMPESRGVAEATPDVLIRDIDSGEVFHLTFADLQEFAVVRPDVHPDAKTFTLPTAQALIEEMPSAMRALLQAGRRPNGTHRS